MSCFSGGGSVRSHCFHGITRALLLVSSGDCGLPGIILIAKMLLKVEEASGQSFLKATLNDEQIYEFMCAILENLHVFREPFLHTLEGEQHEYRALVSAFGLMGRTISSLDKEFIEQVYDNSMNWVEAAGILGLSALTKGTYRTLGDLAKVFRLQRKDVHTI